MQSPSAKIDWLSIGQLVLGVLSCLISFLLTAGLVFLGTSTDVFSNKLDLSVLSLFMLAGLLAAVGLLNIPSIVLSIRSLSSKVFESPIKTSSYRLASFTLISLPIWLAGGQWLVQTNLAVTLLPLVNILALLIPIWWMVEFGRRQLPSGSPQRNWGLISASLGLIPLLTILIEAIAAIVIILVIFSWLGSDPIWMQKFSQLFIQFSQSDFDPEFLTSLFKDLIANPLVITAIFLTMGMLMPLLEELLKPLALWPLRKRLLTPAEGFSAGLVAGAGFALIESATIIAQTGTGADWSQMVILRIATSLLHMTASGFVGWGLARGWLKKKYGRTILTLLAAAGLHGLWNTLAISMALLPFFGSLGGQSPILEFFSGMSTFSFTIILFFLTAALILMNRHLQRETRRSAAESKVQNSV
jgi:hypothetical protein